MPPPAPAKAIPQAPGGVLHQEIPEVPRSASDTIQGHLRVSVRVVVDRSGNVVDETLEEPGPSKYFARLASTAARKWKFAAADKPGPREWLVRFVFSRDQTTAQADAPQ
jgi:TonB family protein